MNIQRQQQQQYYEDREALIQLVIGQMGVGKTHTLLSEIENYLKVSQENSKRNGKYRKVLIFDTNSEPQYFKKFRRTILLRDVVLWSKQPICECRRVLPFNVDGSKMSPAELRKTAEDLGNNAEDLLLVYDDYDKYNRGSSKTRDSSSTFMSNRHRSQDLSISHQSVRAVSTVEWQNASTIRLHKCRDSVDRIENQIDDYEIIKVAELIIWEQHRFALNAIRDGRLIKGSPLAKQRLGYYLIIDRNESLINGNYSKECFIRNCKKYLRIDKKAKLSLSGLLDVIDDKNADDIIVNDHFMQYFNGRN